MGVSCTISLKPLHWKPVFFPHVIFSTKSGVLKFQSLETLRQPYVFSPRGRQWVDGQHLFGYTAENCKISYYIYI
jgi:hypothetical protein